MLGSGPLRVSDPTTDPAHTFFFGLHRQVQLHPRHSASSAFSTFSSSGHLAPSRTRGATLPTPPPFVTLGESCRLTGPSHHQSTSTPHGIRPRVYLSIPIQGVFSGGNTLADKGAPTYDTLPPRATPRAAYTRQCIRLRCASLLIHYSNPLPLPTSHHLRLSHTQHRWCGPGGGAPSRPPTRLSS